MYMIASLLTWRPPFFGKWSACLLVVALVFILAATIIGRGGRRSVQVEFVNELPQTIVRIVLFPEASPLIAVVPNDRGQLTVRVQEEFFEQDVKVHVQLSDDTEIVGSTGSLGGIGPGCGMLTRVVVYVTKSGLRTHFAAVAAIENPEEKQ